MFVAGDPDLAAGVLAEQHAVALPHVERVQLAIVVDASLADREHLALHRLLLGGVGDDEPALGLRFLVDAFHEDPVVQRSYVRHASMLLIGPAHAGQTGLKSNGRAPEWSRLHRMQLTSSDASGANCGGRLVKSTAGRWVKSRGSLCLIATSFSWRLLTIHLLINLSSEYLICLVYRAMALHCGRGEPRRGVPAQEEHRVRGEAQHGEAQRPGLPAGRSADGEAALATGGRRGHGQGRLERLSEPAREWEDP